MERADRLFSKWVRAVGECENCGYRANLQCAHGWSRSYQKVRWDPDNAWCLCKGCHMYFTHRPIEWDDWMREKQGPEVYDRVRAAAVDQSWKVDQAFIAAQVERYRED